MSRLLVVEDDVTIATTLESALRAGGHTVFWASTGRAGINAAIAHKPQLVLLDLGLPDLDGLSVCREIRSLLPATIIVLLTARREELDVVSGLEWGADDYLTKPFRVVEVLARVGAHLRRANGDSGLVQSVPADDVSVLGSLSVNAAARTVQVNGSNVALPAREYDLLARLLSDVGRAVRREDLMNDVWDVNWFGSTKTLDVHVASLRRHLTDAADAAGPTTVERMPVIVTLRGHGYRLEAPTG
ncbi:MULTISPECIES: response regulator transcription factor [unclassified Cryobacterium]|uniref:response regulator transcription factor n=1 Tax=unclassified Cryobacterium TaxID=2649013 RepID=UPI00106C27F9|nr:MULTISPECIES: response regulator transcription factor [unclassified Cryobacterium]TFD03703.1 response regulator transcription factor [Cryobacterium sp. TMT1-66-1]TFD13008.1 response regulator transcription factor [Cryobacterium sp. TMT1-2-2]